MILFKGIPMKFYHLLLFSFLLFIVESLCQRKELTIDDIYSNGRFYGKSLREVHWFDDGNKFSFSDTEKINSDLRHEVNTGEEDVLLTEKELNETEPELSITHYEWSSNDKHILFTNLLPARNVKTGGSFYLYDLRKQQIVLKVESEDEQVNIQFSPDGKNIGFVRGNNLFVVDIET
jgi:dipeptidyl-peptidase-4